jgi:hypothetical protein
MRSNRSIRVLVVVMALLASLQFAGCAGAPVQEMSDAHQSIRAARKAGAERAAPSKLSEAERMLKVSQTHLSRREFREARDAAVQARELAIEARRAAEQAQSPGSSP